MRMRVGLMGGTFDPIHLAHLRVAEEVREKLGLSEIWFIPAGTPPHKRSEPHLPFEERLRMVELAVSGNPAFRVLDIEGRRAGPSYTVETLEELRRLHPEHEFFFILGLDAFLEIETWHEYRRLPDLARLVVVNRGDLDFESARRLSERLFAGREILFVPVRRLDISSTEIRRLVRSGGSIRYLVPEAVRRRIEEHGHYL